MPNRERGCVCAAPCREANRDYGDFGWEIAHGAVTRRPPISLYTLVPRTTLGLGFVHRSSVLCRAVPNLSSRHDSQKLFASLCGERSLSTRPSLQTLQDSILLLPWACSQRDGFPNA
jgi:hypothetical protein